MLRLLTLTGCALLLSLGASGCAGDTLSPDSQPTRFDRGIEPDGPVPYFRDAGCGPGHSGASGQRCPCGGPSGSASGAPCDAGAAPPPDAAPPQPDVCVRPTSWTCEVTFGFAQRGGETTGAIHGDFNGPSPTPWVSRPMTLAAGQWSVKLSLKSGTLLNYKFVIDLGLTGETWFHDASNPNKVPDSFGGFISQLTVSCPNPCDR